MRMQETSKQHRAYRNLLLRHADTPSSMLAEAARSGTGPTPLKLPFILIQVNPEAAVEIQISEDNRQALFDFARCPLFTVSPVPALCCHCNQSGAGPAPDLSLSRLSRADVEGKLYSAPVLGSNQGWCECSFSLSR